MKIIHLILFFLNFPLILLSQNNTVYYNLTYKPNPESVKLISEKYILDVDLVHKISVFRSEKDKKSDSLKSISGLGLGMRKTLEGQLYIVKNLKENKVVKKTELIQRNIYDIKIDESINWLISNDKQKIENFEVQKAVTTYGGRTWTAWFCNEIPINDGPYVFYGLPGLIISMYDDKGDFLFTLSEIKNSSTNNLFIKAKGVSITWSQFKKIALDYYTNPFGEFLIRGMPIKIEDTNGNSVTPNVRELTKREQNRILENNNPIELDKAVKYP